MPSYHTSKVRTIKFRPLEPTQDSRLLRTGLYRLDAGRGSSDVYPIPTGMHELLGPVVWVIHKDAPTPGDSRSPILNQVCLLLSPYAHKLLPVVLCLRRTGIGIQRLA
jgi:hypothetical protein